MTVFDPLPRHWLAWITASSWQLALLIGIVSATCYVARRASARLRHGLWMLVLLKVFLPPSLTTPVSVGQLALGPMLEVAELSRAFGEPSLAYGPSDADATAEAADSSAPGASVSRIAWPPVLLMAAWAGGCLLFWMIVGWRYARVERLTRCAASIDEGPLRIAVEQIAMGLGLRHVPDLLVTPALTGPFLFGVTRPRIVLPEVLVGQLADVEMRAVLTHELVHWKHHDTWIGWLQVLAQSIFWFHPLVWWANRQLRHERECVCDLAVLRQGGITPRNYGESIFRVLTASRGRALVAGTLVGEFERGAKLQNRLEDIMNYQPIQREFIWPGRLAVAAFAILFLPMAPPLVSPQTAEAGQQDTAAAADEVVKPPFPRIVKSAPKRGATGVDPGLKEIAVTFDRDMGRGMSWTGGPPDFPPVDETRQARWIDARTCVLPVKLKSGAYYRVGINSMSHQNFAAGDGTPVPPTAIYFTTKGATEAVERRARAPKIVKITPDNGALDVDPATSALRVTFDMPMGGGMSWTGGGPDFPNLADGKKAAWSKDERTCTLPVALEPDHDYELGLNSASHINFQSKWGVPLEPVVYKFHTRGDKE